MGQLADSGYRFPPGPLGWVKELRHGGLCELRCCVRHSISQLDGVAQFYVPVLGKAEFGGGVYFIG